MIQKTSVKKNFFQVLSLFKWELKRSKTPLIIFAVLAAFFTTSIFSLCMAAASRNAYYSPMYNGETMHWFQMISAYLIFLMTSIYTIIYTVRGFSYLHNKRKADLFSPLPVKATTMFFSKGISSFVFSVVPALFFLWIICLISLIVGQSVSDEVIALFIKIPLGSAACITFYGLIAICCGTSVNTVLSFLAICFAYPIAAGFIKATVDAFFVGINTGIYRDSFLFKALNPLGAYDGVNVIYWILFIIACVALSAILIRRRKAERAQSSYAFRLPCYIVEILISFIAGMLLGTVFGNAGVLGEGFISFIFGFLLGGAVSFVICHAILFRGFEKILKSLICTGAMAALTIIFVAICCFGSKGYVSYVPSPSEIKSAGLINFDMGYFTDEPNLVDVSRETILDSAGDFTDEESIKTIVSFHQAFAKAAANRKTSNSFGCVLSNFVETSVSVLSDISPKSSVAYQLKDGSIVTRYYDLGIFMFSALSDDEDEFLFDPEYDISSITNSSTYLKKYSAVLRLTADMLDDFEISVSDDDYNYEYFIIQEVDGVSKEQAKADKEKIFRAFQEDFLREGREEEYLWDVGLSFYTYPNRQYNDSTTLSMLFPNHDYHSGYGYNNYGISDYYTATIKALKEIGILTKDGKANLESPYAQKWFYDDYAEDWDTDWSEDWDESNWDEL